MSSTRKIIRAFLASPGDLEDERRAVRNVVSEFNETWADVLGYHVELVGWEETVAGYGRPQQLINQDLDRCDLFLGMMWKRWGTPPDKDGKYTSGFEEEFRRSLERREESGSPEISLFFKEVPKEFLSDPGSDLKRVLDFRDSIVSERKILYQNFSAVEEIEALVRKRISTYVSLVRNREQSSGPSDDNAKQPKEPHASVAANGSDTSISPLAKEGFEFLEQLVSRLAQPESLSKLDACDVARFRLLASSVSSSGNDDGAIGVHDINILYLSRIQGIELSNREIRCLTNFGFRFLKNQNVPLWSWYSSLKKAKIDPIVFAAAFGANDDVKSGAISALAALGRELPIGDTIIRREWIIDAFFSKESSATVRSAALKYLGRYGIRDDWTVAEKEYGTSDHGTTRPALECMIRLSTRFDVGITPQSLIINNQFESVDSDILDDVLPFFDLLDAPSLRLGLEHRNPRVRLRAVQVLSERGEIDDRILEQLREDIDAPIRNEAILLLEKRGVQISCKDAEKILKRPAPSSNSLLGFGLAKRFGKTGDKLYEEFEFRLLAQQSEKELFEMAARSGPYEANAYFALVSKNFSTHSKILRKNVDDRFESFFEGRVNYLSSQFNLTSELAQKIRGLSEFLRKGFTRSGLDILCRNRDVLDLDRIRTNLVDGFAGINSNDAIYLSKHGKTSDIQLLAAANKLEKRDTMFSSVCDSNFQDNAAKAIYSIAMRRPVSELLSIELPPDILSKVIELCSEARFAKISQQVLDKLLLHESEIVRKRASQKAILSFPIKRLRKTLNSYANISKFRYYNVIHWLDLGVSMPRNEARRVVKSADF